MLISVALCTCNGEAFLAEQLRSILAQTRRPDEIIVCDDRSDDRTCDLAAALLADSGIRHTIVRHPVRLGPAANFASAFDRCTGELIFPADQDDRWHPEKIERLAVLLQKNPTITMTFCDLDLMSVRGTPTPGSQWAQLGFSPSKQRRFGGTGAFRRLLRYNVVNGNAMAFRRALWPRIRPIPSGWMHDEWIALCCAALGEVRPISKPLVTYRLHASQQVGGAIHGLRQQILYARKRMQTDYFLQQVERARHLHHWLENQPAATLPPCLILLAQAKESHLAIRLTVRSRGSGRLLPILREAISGRYRHFGYGWKSVIQDLFL